MLGDIIADSRATSPGIRTVVNEPVVQRASARSGKLLRHVVCGHLMAECRHLVADRAVADAIG